MATEGCDESFEQKGTAAHREAGERARWCEQLARQNYLKGDHSGFTEEYGVNRPDNKPFRGKICQRRQSAISKLIICILTDPRPGKPWCKC